MSLPTITIIGRLTRDPELRFTPSGHATASLSVACNDRRKDPVTGEWKDGDTTFVDASLWRSDAEAAADQLRKGDEVVIVGRLRQRKYTTRDGAERTVFEADVDTLGKTLRSLAPRQTAASAGVDPWAGAADTAAPF